MSFTSVLYSESFVSSKENSRENPDGLHLKDTSDGYSLTLFILMRQNNKVERLI